MSDWPEYESHKVVRAARIVGFDTRDTGGRVCAIVELPDGSREPFKPNVAEMLDRAMIGDWAMLYPDGYRSISPKRAFEAGYTLTMTAASRLRQLLYGPGLVKGGDAAVLKDVLGALDENERLRSILRAILAADERGQGTPFGEAMAAAAKELDKP